MEHSASRLGVPLARIPSPASHDAAAFCAAGIPFGMLFIRNANGSHHAAEDMDVADFILATSILADWLAGAAAQG
jgi:beta-ureidopropionase / N-carbamoyl-L-amino-acid hydrolase